MLSLAAEAGLRRTEIARFCRRDLTLGPPAAELLVHGKGARMRVAAPAYHRTAHTLRHRFATGLDGIAEPTR